MRKLLLPLLALLLAAPLSAQSTGEVDIANLAAGDICLLQGIGASVMNGGNAYIAGTVPGHAGNPQPDHGTFGAGEIIALEWHPDSSFTALEDPLSNTAVSNSTNSAANLLTQWARLFYAATVTAGEPCIPVVINSAKGGTRILPNLEQPDRSWDPATGTLFQQSLDDFADLVTEATIFFSGSGRTVYELGTMWWGGNDWYAVVNARDGILAANLAVASLRLIEEWYETAEPDLPDARVFWIPSASDIRLGAGTYQGLGDIDEYTRIEEDFCNALPGMCVLAAPREEIIDHVERYLACDDEPPEDQDYCRESLYIVNHALLGGSFQPNHINWVNQLPLAEALVTPTLARYQALTP